MGQGSIFFFSSAGGRTDFALHGLLAISPSSTAAFSTADTFVRIVRT